jgi:methyltransferase (TIGR00027 family)
MTAGSANISFWGLDTFAWRQPAGMQDQAIFEADHPATQTNKREQLAVLGIATPDNLSFVPVDLESGNLLSALQKAGLDPKRPAFVSCLGVIVYLTGEAVDRIFQFVLSLPPASEMVFTFTQKSAGEGLRSSAVAAANLGEPWKTYIEPDELARKITKMGFSSLTILRREEAEQKYFAGRTDDLQAPMRTSIASVIV